MSFLVNAFYNLSKVIESPLMNCAKKLNAQVGILKSIWTLFCLSLTLNTRFKPLIKASRFQQLYNSSKIFSNSVLTLKMLQFNLNSKLNATNNLITFSRILNLTIATQRASSKIQQSNISLLMLCINLLKPNWKLLKVKMPV